MSVSMQGHEAASSRIGRLRALSLMTAVALAMPATAVHAMNMHSNGNELIISGDVDATDAYRLADYLDRLSSEGRKINTLVLRDSDGGSVYAGYAIADIARRYQLTTIASGYCISACSMEFFGGTQRAFAAADQPFMLHANLDANTGQFIGIHGVTGGDGGYADPATQAEFQSFMLQAITNNDPSKTDVTLLKDAFSDHGSAFARIWDSASNRTPLVYWCHSDCANPDQYKAYPNDTAYNIGFITQSTPIDTHDTLFVKQDVSGNINPNYYNIDDSQGRNPITPLTNLLAYYGISFYGDGAFSQASQADEFQQFWASLSPADRKSQLYQLVEGNFVDAYTPQQIQAMLADPNSLLNQQLNVIAQYGGDEAIDRSAYSDQDSWGVISVGQGATWTLNAGQHGDADAITVEQGRIQLNGGVLNAYQQYFGQGAMLSGTGSISQVGSQAEDQPEVWFRDGAILHPTGQGITLAGRTGDSSGNNASTTVLDLGDATLSMNISPSTTLAPLRIQPGLATGNDWHNYYLYYGAFINISPQTHLALNLAPGFYSSGQVIPLVSTDLSGWLNWARVNDPKDYASLTPSILQNIQRFVASNQFISAPISYLQRADLNGQPLSGYAVDPTAGTAFQPFADSLASFHLLQNGNSILLSADDAFTGNPLFCSHQSCGLGTALGQAATDAASPLAPLLGALQFGSRSQAAQAVGRLNGSAWSAQRSLSQDVVTDFSTALGQHLAQASYADGDALAFASLAAPMTLGSAGRQLNNLGMLDYLVAGQDGPYGRPPGEDKSTHGWAQLFGSHANIDGQYGAAGADATTSGILLGADGHVSARWQLGGAVGYAVSSEQANDSSFRGTTHAINAQLYAAYRHEQHFFNVYAGLTHLHTDGSRTVNLADSQLPFYANARTNTSGNAWSLHLDHGWTLGRADGWQWQPILPDIDLIQLPRVNATEHGQGSQAIALDVHAKQAMAARLGGGLRVGRTFTTTGGTHFAPHLQVLYQRQVRQSENVFLNNFAAVPDAGSFAVIGPRTGLNHAMLDLGLDSWRSGRWAATADYSVDASSRTREQRISVGLKYRF